MDDCIDNLVSVHWGLLSVNDSSKNWLVKICCQEKSYQIALSDLSSVFFETMTTEEIELRFKEMNKRLEAPTDKVVDHIHETLLQHCNYNFKVDVNSDTKICLSFSNSFYSGIPFHWRFFCKQTSVSTCESLTKKLLFDPLVLSVSHLMCENRKLQEIISQKDEEIKDYRDSGYKVTRSHLKTELFNKDAFDANLREDNAYAVAITKDPLSIISEKSVNDMLVSSSSDSCSKVIANILQPSSAKSKDSTALRATSGSQSPIKKRPKHKPRPAVRGCVLDDAGDGDNVVDKINNSKVVEPTPIPQTNKPKKVKRRKIF